jgi:hypothetical protein
VKGVAAQELVRQGFWNGVGNVALGGLIFGAVALLVFLIPMPKTTAGTKAKTANACGCSS